MTWLHLNCLFLPVNFQEFPFEFAIGSRWNLSWAQFIWVLLLSSEDWPFVVCCCCLWKTKSKCIQLNRYALWFSSWFAILLRVSFNLTTKTHTDTHSQWIGFHKRINWPFIVSDKFCLWLQMQLQLRSNLQTTINNRDQFVWLRFHSIDFKWVSSLNFPVHSGWHNQ